MSIPADEDVDARIEFKHIFIEVAFEILDVDAVNMHFLGFCGFLINLN